MQRLVLNIDEQHYAVLLQFLKTLNYVKIVQAAPGQKSARNVNTIASNDIPDSQLALLQQVLQKQSKTLFQNIPDPLAWQKQQRDEWS